MGSQSEILFHEILDAQKILVGWTMFFFFALKFGRNSKKKPPCIISYHFDQDYIIGAGMIDDDD